MLFNVTQRPILYGNRLKPHNVEGLKFGVRKSVYADTVLGAASNDFPNV